MRCTARFKWWSHQILTVLLSPGQMGAETKLFFIYFCSAYLTGRSDNQNMICVSLSHLEELIGVHLKYVYVSFRKILKKNLKQL